jgi:hypothetical protein
MHIIWRMLVAIFFPKYVRGRSRVLGARAFEIDQGYRVYKNWHAKFIFLPKN